MTRPLVRTVVAVAGLWGAGGVASARGEAWPPSPPVATSQPLPGPGCDESLALAGRRIEALPADLFAGASFRQLAIQCGRVDHAIELFQRLAARAPAVLELRLNLGLAYVDKVPTEGDFRQAMLGRAALKQFERSISVRPTWLAYHTRGVIYLFYPSGLGLTDNAIANLERALALLRGRTPRPYHARTYVALGDAHFWRRHDKARAVAVWQQGLSLFPDDPALQHRVHGTAREVHELVDAALNADVRIDTSLRELMDDPDALR
jgi:tetratricopeptide (TPR) repeat protein